MVDSEYYRDYMKDLTAFVPYSANQSLELYVKADVDNSLDLTKHHFNLYNAVEEIQA